MTGRRGRRRLTTATALVVMAACAEGRPESEPQDLRFLEITPNSSLQIGAQDGEPSAVGTPRAGSSWAGRD